MAETQLLAERTLIQQVTLFTISRTVINTGMRMVFPLLPVFARAVNVEIAAIAFVVMIGQLLGLIAPFLGGISERRGQRFTILLGLVLFTLGLPAVFIMPNFWGLAVALLIASLGKITFDPAAQAYLGDHVPYSRRGQVLGILELGWSTAFFIGVPIMTWLIARFNWQAPFLALAIASGLMILGTTQLVRPGIRKPATQNSLLRSIRIAVDTRTAAAGLVLGFSISGANQLINVVFGTWIEASFGIMLGALAAAAAVIGFSELLGEGAVVSFSDRFGKRRLVILGLVGNIIASFILPLTSFNLNVALLGLFFFFLTFEMGLVATFPLATELSPSSRAMYMSVLVTAMTLGRASMTSLAPLLFNGGLYMNVIAATVLNLIALIAVSVFINVDQSDTATA